MVKQTFSVQPFVQWTTRLMYDGETAADAAAAVTDVAAAVTAAAVVVKPPPPLPATALCAC